MIINDGIYTVFINGMTAKELLWDIDSGQYVPGVIDAVKGTIKVLVIKIP